MDKILTGKLVIIDSHLGMEDGSWISLKLNKPEEITGYTYNPENKKLHIDRSDYEPDGFCSIYAEECYRVVHVRKNTYWLYLLDGVGTEPDDIISD